MRYLVLLLSVISVAAAGQEVVPRFSAAVQLVEVYASVADSKGGPVTGLTAADFVVTEDGEPQEISAFAAGEFPLSVALGVDRSFSMAGEPLRLAKDASRAFLNELRPSDRSMILAISSTADVIAPMGTDRASQSRAIAALDAWSTTALRDAIVVAMDRLQTETGRQALIVFSDGVDRYSGTSTSHVMDRARRSQALVYPIAFGKTRPPLLAELAVLTGGRSFLLRDAKELAPTLSAIARELRYQYLIGYVPARAAPAGAREWRSIRVTLSRPRPDVRVRARDGYMTE
jgi:Ca-activated chloride channel family protein